MTLLQLEYFMKVAEELNFTKAARKLYVSQQGISRQIRSLEKELGFPLFARTTRNVTLTENGKKLYRMLEDHRRGFHELISDAVMKETSSQVVRLGILDASRIIDFILPVTDRLQKAYPHITWEYQTGNFKDLQDGLDRNELDMIVTLSTELPQSHPAEQTLVLKFLRLAMFIAKDHPLAARDSLSILDLEKTALLTYDPSFSYDAADFVMEDCKQNGIQPAAIRYYSNFNTIEMAVLAGKGIAIGFDIFYRDPLHKIKAYPMEKAKGLKIADLVMAWNKPEYKVFAKIFGENLPLDETE